MFQDGSMKTISSASPHKWASFPWSVTRRDIESFTEATNSQAVYREDQPTLTRAPAQCSDASVHRNIPTHNTSLHRFPLNDFKFYLTLFSKCFSSFLHSTCSLSVSHRYLALDGIYHPIWSALPSKPTQRKHVVRHAARAKDGTITLLG